MVCIGALIAFGGFHAVKALPLLATYLALGFGFVVAMSGVVVSFLELKKVSEGSPSLTMTAGTGDLGHAVNQLGRNYDVLRRQVTQGFIIAGTMMVLGLCVILAGAAGQLFGFAQAGSNLTVIAGVVVEAISGIGMYLFNRTFERLNVTSDRLHETWRVLTAFSKLDALPEDRRADVTVTLITHLVSPPPAPAQLPSGRKERASKRDRS